MTKILDSSPGLEVALKDILEYEAGIAQRKAADHRKAVRSLTKYPDGVIFQVQLLSLWADEEDIHVTYLGNDGLENAIQKAQTEFRIINNRTDVQAKYVVHALIGRNAEPVLNHPVLVPKKFYEHLI